MIRPSTHLAAALALAFASFAAGCTTSSVVNEAEPPAPDTAAAPTAEPPADAPKDEPAPTASDIGKVGLATGTPVDGKAEGAKGSKGDGSACDKAEECASGVCEGEGCGPGQGKCAPKDRPCTRDLRPYCGCDGKTFQSSGSCPGARFSKKAACEGDAPGPSVPKP